MGSPCIELFDGFRCVLAELVATFIFVFAGQGSVVAFGKRK
jgi:glycerol uptake facilitator-like aquaporin